MLKSISWGSFFSFLAVLVVLYYLALAVYFRQFLIKKLRSRKRSDLTPSANGTGLSVSGGEPPAEFVLTERVAGDLKRILQKVGSDKVEREDVLLSIKSYLKEVIHLKNTPYGLAINNLIVIECRNKCDVDLSAEEVRSLWEK